MNIPTLRTVAAAFFLLLIVSTGSSNDYRDFTNTAGKAIKGKILSATESDVTLELEDGRNITGGVAFFSESDRAFITAWRKANPVQIQYDFDIGLSRKRTERDKKTEGNLISIYESWLYEIKVANRSRNGASGEVVKDAEIHYNLIKSAKSRAREARYLHESLKSAGGNLVKTGKVKLGDLEYLKETIASTETIPINHSELAPGWYYADGKKDAQVDTFEGIKLRVVKDGKMLYETTNGTKEAENSKWIEP